MKGIVKMEPVVLRFTGAASGCAVTSIFIQRLRAGHRESQEKFWAKIGVSQSGGSRYENGQRPLPKPIIALINELQRRRDTGNSKKFNFREYSGTACQRMRTRRGLNQTEFWEKIGVTQSGGSRYENGANMPPWVTACLNLVYPRAGRR